MVILLAVLLCLLVVGGVVAFVIYSNNKRAAEQERTEAELKEKEESIEELSRTNDSLKAANARKPKTVTKVIVEHHQTPQSATSNRPTRVVINGTGVRMRLGPGTEYDYPVTSSGRAYTVPKGTSLPYLGESGNWNKVMFEGSAYWVSKDFSYLQ